MPSKLAEFMFDRIGVPRFGKYLDLAAFRHKLVSGNIANASTPGYRRQDVDFQAEFERLTGTSGRLAGTTTHPDHVPLGQHQQKSPEVEQARVGKDDMNSVDIDREIATLAKNELLFTVGARLLQKKLSGLRTAITSK